jgi:hypothetical protein
MNELCILQDDVPPVPNQVYGYSRYLFFKIILEYVQMKLE